MVKMSEDPLPGTRRKPKPIEYEEPEIIRSPIVPPVEVPDEPIVATPTRPHVILEKPPPEPTEVTTGREGSTVANPAVARHAEQYKPPTVIHGPANVEAIFPEETIAEPTRIASEITHTIDLLDEQRNPDEWTTGKPKKIIRGK
jgi:hypothetical protein